MRFTKRKIVSLTSLAILFPNAVLADQAATPGVPLQAEEGPAAREMSRPMTLDIPTSPLPSGDPLKPTATPRPASVPEGFRIGTFVVRPEVSLTELYDDNIYATRSREADDLVTVISPTLSLKSNWERHSLNLWTGADKDIYRSNSSENVTDHWLEAQGRIDISEKSNIYGGAGISRNHEDRAVLDDPDRASLAAEPTRYWETKAHLGVFHQFERIALRLGTTYEHLDFSNVAAIGGGIVNMNDRDRKLYSAGGRATFKISDRYEAFLQAASDTRRYDQNDVGRDSDGYRLSAGMGFDFGGNNKAEFYVGHLVQNYKNALLADVSKPYFGADAKFAIGPSTYLTAYLDRELAETTITGASSYLDTTIGARVDHDFTQDFSVNGRLAYSRSAFQGIDRNEDYLDAGFGAKYYLGKDIYIAGDYRIMLRETNANTTVVNGIQNTFDYDKNQIFISIGYTPGRVPRPVAVANAPGIYLAASEMQGLELPVIPSLSDYSGFYAGAQTGYGALSTEMFSQRSDGGTDEMDLGKNGGQTSGFFAGYGRMWNRWYYGLELEAETSSANWYHSKTKADARTMSLDKNDSVGLSVRGGYALPGGLLYGRLGMVRTDFDTYDTENQFAATGAYDKANARYGQRYGVGIDIPAGSNLLLRMDYTYTRYNAHDAASQANVAGTEFTVDRFDNRESLFRVGLGWRFNAEGTPPAKIDPASARGFYAGARMGYGVMGSRMDAIHNDGGGSGCSNCAFTGDFGNAGTTLGFFGGYGTTFSRIYLGLEVEADASNAEWTNNRDSGGGGRDVSVSKKGGYGASAKLGYVLENGTLLYVRAGQMHTRFNTLYNKGNVNNWVDRDDMLKGNRFGIGAEVPAYRTLFVKLDYTRTDYTNYGFTTQHANADTVNFDNRETLFSLGLGMRF